MKKSSPEEGKCAMKKMIGADVMCMTGISKHNQCIFVSF
jgi:hypothetical protein